MGHDMRVANHLYGRLREGRSENRRAHVIGRAGEGHLRDDAGRHGRPHVGEVDDAARLGILPGEPQRDALDDGLEVVVAARRRRCASADPDCTVACRDAKAIPELLGLVDGPSRVAVAEYDVVVLQVVDVQLFGVDEHDGPVLLV